MNNGYSLSKIAEITGGNVTGEKSLSVTELITDSRRIVFAPQALFIALKGPNHDGHRFINQAYKQGVRSFLVEQLPGQDAFPGGGFVTVKDTLEALQAIAAYQRSLFYNPVIAVTGSNGKTIVKEWLTHLLAYKHQVIRSPGSYNSQVGVPLSLWLLKPEFDYAVIEAGISKPGEMKTLEKMIRPDIGVFTNIGDAHQEGFTGLKQKLYEKLRLFEQVKMLVARADQQFSFPLIKDFCVKKGIKLFSWGYTGRPYLKMIKTVPSATGTKLFAGYNGKRYEAEIPMTDVVSLENSMHVAATLLALGIPPEDIFPRLADIQPVAMRMEIKKGVNDCLLINDYYNSDYHSLSAALVFLKQQKGQKRKTLILSDIFQSGRPETELYKDVAGMVKEYGITKFIGVGNGLYNHKGFFSGNTAFYLTTDELKSNLHEEDFRREVILLKGARKYHFEDVSAILEKQVHNTILEVNLDNMVHNLNFYKTLLHPGTRIMAMVKAFSYGSGMYEIAQTLEHHQVDFLAVAYPDEGVALREAGIRIPIVVMNTGLSGIGQIIKYNLEPVLYGKSQMEYFCRFFYKEGIFHYPVHLKLDTGMHRLGFLPGETDALAGRIRNEKTIYIRSLFSHLAAGNDPLHDIFTRKQIGMFEKMYDGICKTLPYKPYRHILNTAGIERFPDAEMDMVRLGLGLYGISNKYNKEVKPVSTFKSIISQIKKVKAGESVGYGREEVAGSDMDIAVIPVGYADGLPLRLGNRKGSVYIANSKVPLIGKICMDMCMADITNLDVKEGDEVEIFGSNQPVSVLSKQAGTIPYDIIAGISARVKRNYIRENE